MKNTKHKSDNEQELKSEGPFQTTDIVKLAVNSIHTQEKSTSSPKKGTRGSSATVLFQRSASKSKKKKSLSVVTRLINSKGFIIFSSFITTLNLILLASNRSSMSESGSSILRIFNILFTFYFAMEIILRIIGLGIKNFVKDSINLFDVGVVAASSVLIVIDIVRLADDPSRGVLTALRMVRIIRIFKTSEQFKKFRSLIRTLSRTIVDLRDFLMLLLIFIVIFALLGRELYSYHVRFLPDGKATKKYWLGESKRLNFDTFWDALVTVFVVLTSDGWNFIMYDHVRTSDGPIAIGFFFSIQLFGSFMLVKLFVGMVINNFAVTAQREKEEEALLEADPLGSMLRGVEGISSKLKRFCCFRKKTQPLSTEKTKSSLELTVIETTSKIGKSEGDILDQSSSSLTSPTKTGDKRSDSKVLKEVRSGILSNLITKTKIANKLNAGDEEECDKSRRLSFIETVPHVVDNQESTEKRDIRNYAGVFIHADNLKDHNNPWDTEEDEEIARELDPQKAKAKKNKKFAITGKSLSYFDPTSTFRLSCVSLVRHKKFDSFVAIFIVISSINLALDRPMMDPSSRERVIIRMIDLALTLAFSVECSIKIIAYGFLLNGQHSYLRSLVNCLDFFVVIAGLLSFDDTFSESLDALRILRITRVLRPLRLIARSEGLKIVINSIVASLPSLLRLVVVNGTFLFVFATIVMNSLKGKLHHCNHTNIELDSQALIQTKSDCLDYGGDWVNDDVNFDSIFMSMSSLFQVATLDDWSNVMLKAVDAVAVDHVQVKGHNPNWRIFFVFYVILGSFFMISTFAGVIVDVFNREKDKAGGLSLITREQTDWLRVQLSALRMKPKVKPIPHTHPILIKMTKLVTSPKYELFMNSLVVCNLILFTLYWNRMSKTLKEVLKYVGNCFLTSFTTEAVMKMIVLRRAYFRDNWNLFSLTILCITLSSTILTTLKIVNFGKSTAGIRSLRVFRLLRMIRKAKNLRIIFTILISTLPAIFNIGAFLLLIMFVYSILGMNLFGYLRLQDGIGPKANFSSFSLSFITLLRASTGEDWSRLMKDGAREFGPNFVCYDVGNYDEYLEFGRMSCGTNYAYLYFITYQLVLSMILINLFMAVIIKTFEETSKAESFLIPSHNFTQFVDSWKKFDGDAISFIPLKDLEDFFMSLEQPMGWKGRKMTRAKKSLFFSSLNIPIYQFEDSTQKYYYFYDVALMVARKVVSENYFTDDLDPPIKIEIVKQIDALRTQRFKTAVQSRGVIMLEFTSAHHNAVRVLEKYCRSYRERKERIKAGLPPLPLLEPKPIVNTARRRSSLFALITGRKSVVSEKQMQPASSIPPSHSTLGIKSPEMIRKSINISSSNNLKRESMSQLSEHGSGSEDSGSEREPPKNTTQLDTSIAQPLNDSSNLLIKPKRAAEESDNSFVERLDYPFLRKETEHKPSNTDDDCHPPGLLEESNHPNTLNALQNDLSLNPEKTVAEEQHPVTLQNIDDAGEKKRDSGLSTGLDSASMPPSFGVVQDAPVIFNDRSERSDSPLKRNDSGQSQKRGSEDHSGRYIENPNHHVLPNSAENETPREQKFDPYVPKVETDKDLDGEDSEPRQLQTGPLSNDKESPRMKAYPQSEHDFRPKIDTNLGKTDSNVETPSKRQQVGSFQTPFRRRTCQTSEQQLPDSLPLQKTISERLDSSIQPSFKKMSGDDIDFHNRLSPQHNQYYDGPKLALPRRRGSKRDRTENNETAPPEGMDRKRVTSPGRKTSNSDYPENNVDTGISSLHSILQFDNPRKSAPRDMRPRTELIPDEGLYHVRNPHRSHSHAPTNQIGTVDHTHIHSRAESPESPEHPFYRADKMTDNLNTSQQYAQKRETLDDFIPDFGQRKRRLVAAKTSNPQTNTGLESSERRLPKKFDDTNRDIALLMSSRIGENMTAYPFLIKRLK